MQLCPSRSMGGHTQHTSPWLVDFAPSTFHYHWSLEWSLSLDLSLSQQSPGNLAHSLQSTAHHIVLHHSPMELGQPKPS